jgi:hypothetical protein
MPISEKLKALIRSAWDDGAPCLVATQGPNGPNISPKGSMVVFDDEHLACWDRSKKQTLQNLGHDKRVCVIYANFKAQRDGVLESGFLRFYGKAELHESGPVDNAIFNLLLPREQTHVGACGAVRQAGMARREAGRAGKRFRRAAHFRPGQPRVGLGHPHQRGTDDRAAYAGARSALAGLWQREEARVSGSGEDRRNTGYGIQCRSVQDTRIQAGIEA